jgi:hypothetical protein
MKKSGVTISERELKEILASLREEAAAPPQFREGILKRVAASQGLSYGVRSTEGYVFSRVFNWLARPVLLPALAASGMIALGFWVAFKAPAPQKAALSPTRTPEQAAVPALIAKNSAPSRLGSSQIQIAKLPNPKKAPNQVQTIHPSQEAPKLGLATQSLPASAQGASQVQKPASTSNFAVIQAPQPPQPAAPGFGGGSFGGPAASGASLADAKASPTAVQPSPTPAVSSLEGNSQVRRNKFRASLGEYASILFKLKAPGKVRIEIYDRIGRLIAVPHEADHASGIFEVRWFGQDDKNDNAPTGIYLLRIKGPDFDERHKLVLLR